MDDAHLRVSFYGAPGTDVALNTTDLAELEPVGLITRLENRLTHLEAIKAQTLADIDHARSEVSHATASLCKPFPQATELVGAFERVRHIEEQLQAAAAPSHDEQRSGATRRGQDVQPAEHGPPPRVPPGVREPYRSLTRAVEEREQASNTAASWAQLQSCARNLV